MKLNAGFPILLADPPWKELSQRDLCAMRPLLDRVVHKNSVLLLYSTLPKLPDAMQVMAAWGYKYVTSPFVLVKLNHTGSVETQGRDIILKRGAIGAEIVLMGKRGRGCPKQCRTVKQVVFSVNHSEIIGQIQQVFGSVPILELFVPGKKVRGVLKVTNLEDLKGLGNAEV